MKKRYIALLTTALVLGSFIMYHQISWKPYPGNHHVLTHTDVADSSYRATIANASQRLSQLVADLNVPSASIAVAVNGKLVWSEAKGYADVENLVAATPQTIYRIGSTSKAVTASAIMLLVQEGKLDLDQPVGEILPSYPPTQWPFTTRQLLSHTAGIPDYEDLDIKGLFYSQLNFKEYHTVEEGLQLFKHIPLLFQPNTQFKYNSLDIVLASRVLEEVSGTSFPEYLNQRLCQPQHMTSTYVDRWPQKPKHRAEFYETDKKGYYKIWHTLGFPHPDQNLSYKWAGGGLLSTPTDLVLLGNAFLNDTVMFNRQVRNEFFTPKLLADGTVNEQEYAFGWRSYNAYSSEKLLGKEKSIWMVHHAGVSKGSMNFLCLFPDQNVVVNVAVNGRPGQVNFSPFWDHVMQLAQPFLLISGFDHDLLDEDSL